MPRNHDDDDDEDLQEIDREWAAAQDDDDDETHSCGRCGFEMHALATKCPQCGAWKAVDSPAARRGRSWGTSLIIAMLVATILVFWVGLR